MTTTNLPTLLSSSFTTTAGSAHVDLTFSTAMSKGVGSVFVTDGAIQTVINRATGEPEVRVVGASFTREIPLSQVSISGAHVAFDATGLAAGSSYNVFIGPGALLAGGRPFGGITAPGQAAFTTLASVPAATLGASIAIEDRTLKAGADLSVTVTFTESVTTLSADAFSAEHAAVKDITRSSDGRTWTLTLGALDSVESASNLLRLDMGQVTATSGLRGSGMLASSPYAVDTIVGAWLDPVISVNDTGPLDDDGITGDTRQVVSGVLAGSLAADEHIELFINDRLVDPALIHLVGEGDGWGWYYDANDEAGEPPRFGEGVNTIVARIVKADGHSSATVVQQVVVDTDAPAITTSPNGATDLAVGADIVITFDEAMYWQDEEGDADILSLYGDNGTVTKIYLSAEDFSADGRTLTIKAASHKLQADVGYSLRLPENLMDIAGNPLGGYDIAFHTVGIPSAVRVFLDGDGNYRAGQTLTFRIRFDEDVRIVGDAIPSIGLSNGKQAQLAAVNGNELSFRYTVAAGDDWKHLAITNTTELAGNVEDLAGNVLDAAHIVFSGVYDGAGHGLLDIDIDTVAAAPGSVRLADASNTGSLLDSITASRSPTLTGTAEAHALVEIFEGETRLGSGYANADGVWEVDVTANHALADGLHEISVRQTDQAGNTSDAAPLALSIDAAAPAALSGVFLATDNGISNADRLTSESYAVLGGAGAEAHAGIKIMLGSDVVGVGSADENGNWTAHFGAALGDGVHTVTVLQHDAAGNAGALSAPFSFTVDLIGPTAAPPAPLLAALSDTGILDNDGITNDSTPTFTGSGALANSMVGLYIDEQEVGAATTDASGNWSITLEEALDDGSYSVQLKQFDDAGNDSPYSSSFHLVIDSLVALGAPTLSLAAASDSGASSSDLLTNVRTPTFGGVAQAGSEVALMVGNAEVGRATADATGNWSLTIAEAKALADGTHQVRVHQVDAAGNVGADSAALAVTIDTRGPELTDHDGSLLGNKFSLSFSEAIRFHTTGRFELEGLFGQEVFDYANAGNGWTITGLDTVLNFNISLTGLLRLEWTAGSVVDLAGNAAVIGTPEWNFTIF